MHRLKTVLRHIGTRGVSTFKAGYFEKTADGPQFSVRELQLSDLPQEAVLVQIDYSTLNYKDALAITNAGPIIKTFPMVGGVDYAGTVMESDDPDLKVGDKVLSPSPADVLSDFPPAIYPCPCECSQLLFQFSTMAFAPAPYQKRRC